MRFHSEYLKTGDWMATCQCRKWATGWHTSCFKAYCAYTYCTSMAYATQMVSVIGILELRKIFDHEDGILQWAGMANGLLNGKHGVIPPPTKMPCKCRKRATGWHTKCSKTYFYKKSSSQHFFKRYQYIFACLLNFVINLAVAAAYHQQQYHSMMKMTTRTSACITPK